MRYHFIFNKKIEVLNRVVVLGGLWGGFMSSMIYGV